jgi:glucosylceramidase
MLKQAQAISNRPIKLFAAAWSPPVWMKTNKNINGNGVLEKHYYQLWADYHIR